MNLSKILKESYTVENLLDYAENLREQTSFLDLTDATPEEIAKAEAKVDATIDLISDLAFNGDTAAVNKIFAAEYETDAATKEWETITEEADEKLPFD